jgi:ABC-type oligopeptide transport system ATPase subunit
MTSQPLLQVRELSKYFPVTHGIVFTHKVGDIKAVDRISFDLYASETLGLVGESGCGKTTTGRAMLKLIEPSGGQILYSRFFIMVTTLPRSTKRRWRRSGVRCKLFSRTPMPV